MKSHKAIKIIAIVLASLIVVGIGVFVLIYYLTFRPSLVDIDPNNPPKIIQADFIDLSKIYSISKFRSDMGHDFSDSYETCRSMKHYFGSNSDIPESVKNGTVDKTTFLQNRPSDADSIDIYSPVDGTITSIEAEKTPIGRQVWIKPDSNQAFTIRIFHVFTDSGITEGMKVTAGQKIGVISKYQATDIAVEYNYLDKNRLLSYFSVMPDSVFQKYIDKGATSKDDFIISKDYRDAHPLQCASGSDSFTAGSQSNGDQEPRSINNVYLSGYSGSE